MINFGMVKPGSTIFIPFNTFSSNDPSASVAIAAFIVGDISIYKDGGVTQRASTSGVVLLETDGIDFDGHVGIGGFSINLSDNDTAGFYVSGSKYFIVVGPTTVDAGVVNFVAASFEIGYPDAIWNTGIASLTSATQFILDKGPAEADVLIGSPVIIHNVASEVQFAFGVVSDYIVTTKEVFLAGTPVGFTPAATDNVAFFMPTDLHSVRGTVQTAGDLVALLNTLATTADLLDKLGAVDEAAAAGDPSATESVMQYIKQLVNLIAGSTGIGTMPSAADPANGINLFEMLRAAMGATFATATDSLEQLQADHVTLQSDTDDIQTQIGTAGAGLTDLGGMSTGMKAEIIINAIAYAGPRGPGVYLNDAAGNTNTVDGVDGIIANPVSTIVAAKTLADSMSLDRIYLINDSTITLAATMNDYEFVGIGEFSTNSVNLGSQDVGGSHFINLLIQGIQGGTTRIQASYCDLFGPSGLRITAMQCAFAGTLTLAATAFFNGCWSAAAGSTTPVLDIDSVASVGVNLRDYSGGIQFDNAVATTTVSLEGKGQYIIDATCTSIDLNVRGNFQKTDNGTTSVITDEANINKTNINDEVVDVINTDTSGEPGQEAPAATLSLRGKIDRLYKSWRNLKKNDGSTTELYDDAGTTVDSKQTTSESAGTVTKGEWVSGP